MDTAKNSEGKTSIKPLSIAGSGATTAATGDVEQQITGQYNNLGWKRLTVILIVEAVALGALSLPHAFHTLGMVAGVLLTVIVGFIAIYTSYIVGRVKVVYPEVSHYTDVGKLLFGKAGYEIFGFMFVMQLILLVGGHCLTGAIAMVNITGGGICSLWFGAMSTVVLLLLAVPPSFAELAVLGYIDFISIVLAIGITIIATGAQASQAEGGLAAVEWSAWPKPDLTFSQTFVAISNIVLSYAFAVCQITFMDEMHTPKDFIKSTWTLGIVQIVIYTLTGSLIYAFVGPHVQSPAILSAGGVISKIAFGVALPVIFISGSINTTVTAKYIYSRICKSTDSRKIQNLRGWTTWLILITTITIVAWVLAETIPFFSNLLSLCSSLFISGFTLYFPPVMWFKLLRRGPWHSRENILLSIVNVFVFVLGVVMLFGGTYSSISEIASQYASGSVREPFTCIAAPAH
ncbi:transmembrane amino acid transporter protein-domain-containing protein [Stachybotrys elegans]|uniref:Transmembrane amino acid transporter protein-domain-containing protein n=1 Tax=Stachybotrys elegans TaxID=80388 RepID=A0A8K0WQG0_9HYPO|nr:transmembrane amino acid transporter protein-domain-containing protein [Stachybotrys elegans]